ncbi:MAG: peptidase U32 family protein, partial [Candidatus Scatosoma sp.]
MKTQRNQLEILSPAGNAECARAALNAGADALYLGYGRFSARAAAENFSGGEMKSVIDEAHLFGAKVYVAMNTLVKDDETEDFIRTLCAVWGMGADAVILQDLFLGKAIKKAYPQIVLHLSTQAGVCNANGASLAKEYGFSRVILARETPIKEIEKIAEIIETEAFVQGALCTCFSGQCYFSSFAGGNSGNRGRCKQPCRKKYVYNRTEKAGTNAANAEKTYALSLSDLCVGEDVFTLAEIGVKSFKIEGRMRSKEYVAAATEYYDALLRGAEGVKLQTAFSDLKRAYNRGNYTKGLAFGQDKRLLSPYV